MNRLNLTYWLFAFLISFQTAYAQFPEKNGLDISYRLSATLDVKKTDRQQLSVYQIMPRTSLGLRYGFQVTSMTSIPYYQGILNDPENLVVTTALLSTIPFPVAHHYYLVRLHAGPVWQVAPFALENFQTGSLPLTRTHFRTMVEIDHFRWFAVQASVDWQQSSVTQSSVTQSSVTQSSVTQSDYYPRRSELMGIFKLLPTPKRSGNYLLGVMAGIVEYKLTQASGTTSRRIVPQAGVSVQPF